MVKSTASPKSFTARDLNRSPARVFEAVRKYGSVDINTRDGDTFVVSMKESDVDGGKMKEEPDFAARHKKLREMGYVPPPASEMERISRVIAGEE